MMRVSLSAGLAAGLVACLLGYAAQAQVSGNVIKIGVLTDLAGSLTENTGQGSIAAAQLAVEDFGGAINGIPIELVTADHQNKVDVGTTTAQQWYDAGVDMIVDLPNSGVALAVQKVAAEKNRIAMVSSAAASSITGKACTATTVHWTYNTTALARVTGGALAETGLKSWFFITADYAFGHLLEKETAAVVTANGGTSVGSVRFPTNNGDFSPVLMQAQVSGAQVLAVSSAGADTTATISQASEFGILQSSQKLAVLLLALNEVHALGLEMTQGISLADAYYWDTNDATRAFATRFAAKRNGAKPNMYQAGVAGAVTHYLKTIKAVGTDQTEAVMAKMRETPVNDFMTTDGALRPDGRVVRDMGLYQVKTPAESTGPWDYYKLIKVVPAEQVFGTLAESECPLVKK